MMKLRFNFRKWFKVSFWLALVLSITISINFAYVQFCADEYCSTELSDIPKNKVGLLLGTSKYLKNGRINAYYQFRIDATVRLFQAGLIEYVLISGDNGTKSYNEPETMRDDLIARGIPASKIYLDYAGFRTLDSVVRAKEIFSQQEFTVISQKFHNERAIYLARHFGIRAYGYNASEVSVRYGFKVTIREYFARFKMQLDLLFGVEPKFLGEKIEIK